MKTETEVNEVTTSRRDVVNYGRLLVGAILVVGGIGWLLDAANILKWNWGIYLSVALIVVGLAIIAVGGRFRTRSSLIALGTVLTVILAIGAVDVNRSLLNTNPRVRSGVGDRQVRPLRASQIPDQYRLQFGSLSIDLTELDLPSGTTEINASVGTGQLHVDLPRDLAFDLDGRVGAGQMDVLDQIDRSGANLREEFVTEDYAAADRRVLLKMSVGLGQLEVKRATS